MTKSQTTKNKIIPKGKQINAKSQQHNFFDMTMDDDNISKKSQISDSINLNSSNWGVKKGKK